MAKRISIRKKGGYMQNAIKITNGGTERIDQQAADLSKYRTGYDGPGKRDCRHRGRNAVYGKADSPHRGWDYLVEDETGGACVKLTTSEKSLDYLYRSALRSIS